MRSQINNWVQKGYLQLSCCWIASRYFGVVFVANQMATLSFIATPFYCKSFLTIFRQRVQVEPVWLKMLFIFCFTVEKITKKKFKAGLTWLDQPLLRFIWEALESWQYSTGYWFGVTVCLNKLLSQTHDRPWHVRNASAYTNLSRSSRSSTSVQSLFCLKKKFKLSNGIIDGSPTDTWLFRRFWLVTAELDSVITHRDCGPAKEALSIDWPTSLTRSRAWLCFFFISTKKQPTNKEPRPISSTELKVNASKRRIRSPFIFGLASTTIDTYSI